MEQEIVMSKAILDPITPGNPDPSLNDKIIFDQFSIKDIIWTPLQLTWGSMVIGAISISKKGEKKKLYEVIRFHTTKGAKSEADLIKTDSILTDHNSYKKLAWDCLQANFK